MSFRKFLPIMSISIALSLILSYIEFLLPSIGVPGVKLGLANLIILMLLIKYPLKVPAAVNIARRIHVYRSYRYDVFPRRRIIQHAYYEACHKT